MDADTFLLFDCSQCNADILTEATAAKLMLRQTQCNEFLTGVCTWKMFNVSVILFSLFRFSFSHFYVNYFLQYYLTLPLRQAMFYS